MIKPKKQCALIGCEMNAKAKGYCDRHWRNNHLYGGPTRSAQRPTDDERFWAKVRKTESCWIWTSALDSSGYGAFRMDGTTVRAHRYAFEQANGKVPTGMHLDHLCRVRECCNPAHLEIVTPAENTRRGFSPTMVASRTDTCARGHSLSDAYIARRSNGKETRRCRTCATTRAKKKPKERVQLALGDRAKLLERSGGACYWCGLGMTDNTMHLHHRLLRSQGGTWELSNIIGVHGKCHNVEAGSIHQEISKARTLGFIIRQSGNFPAHRIPVYERATGFWWLLDVDGGREAIQPALAAELLFAAGSLLDIQEGETDARST